MGDAGWVQCRTPCAFDDKVCGHDGCDKIHTHARRLQGMAQHLWPVACDVHATHARRLQGMAQHLWPVACDEHAGVNPPTPVA